MADTTVNVKEDGNENEETVRLDMNNLDAAKSQEEIDADAQDAAIAEGKTLEEYTTDKAAADAVAKEAQDAKDTEAAVVEAAKVAAGKTPEEIAAAKAQEDIDVAAAALASAKKDVNTTDEQISELRNMLRDMRNENIKLQAQVAEHDRVQKGDIGDPGTPGQLEELHMKLQELGQRDFSHITAIMEVNPKYEDFKTICTNERFEDIFEAVAQQRVSESNGKLNFNVALLQAKTEVWGMPNPYKYMYEVIKEYHPDFTTANKTLEELAEEKKVVDASAEALKKKDAKAVVKELKPVVAPGSIADLGGGAFTQGGWTAERIDGMAEAELHKVPRDVYEAYLRGDLDK